MLQHRDTPDNNASTPFAWTEESKKKIAFVLNKFPPHYRMSGMIPILYIAQEQNGTNWLTLNAMNAVRATRLCARLHVSAGLRAVLCGMQVAEVLGCAPIRVYEVATFYTMVCGWL